ncbi:MAG: dihydrofolate reductase [Nocardioidaceae bacterium]|nr:dihydrofolate reductase [Nocardioidaceae bacterium]
MTVTLVAAIARNQAIGRAGGLPWHLPGDLQRFKAATMGHVVVMGRRTYDSIGRPLPGRTTIVVTRQPGWQPPGGPAAGLVETAPSVKAALHRGQQLDEQVFVAGGGQIYADALPLADRMLLTWVDAEPEGDAFFPSVDWDQWVETKREQQDGWALAGYARVASPLSQAARSSQRHS